MCASCGCGRPNDTMGDDRHLTMQDLTDAAEAANITVEEVARNIKEATSQQQGGAQGQQQGGAQGQQQGGGQYKQEQGSAQGQGTGQAQREPATANSQQGQQGTE